MRCFPDCNANGAIPSSVIRTRTINGPFQTRQNVKDRTCSTDTQGQGIAEQKLFIPAFAEAVASGLRILEIAPRFLQFLSPELKTRCIGSRKAIDSALPQAQLAAGWIESGRIRHRQYARRNVYIAQYKRASVRQGTENPTYKQF